MSMLTRRAVLRALPRSRGYATTGDVIKNDWAEKQAALRTHAAETANMWRKISFYVCLPGIAVVAAWVRNVEEEHAAHLAHAPKEELPAYEFLNRRVKPFPWGPNSLFFNPHVNKDLSQVEE